MYTPFEVSGKLNIPPSTLRRLSKQFEAFLSHQKSRRRRYTTRDIDTLRAIRERLEKGMTYKQIEGELANIIDIGEQEEQEGEEASTSLAPIDKQLNRLASQYAFIAKELEELRASREEDRARLKALEEYLSRPWFERVFRKPPKP